MRNISSKICKNFPNFSKMVFEKFFWALDIGKLRMVIIYIAKIHKTLVKKETSDVLSCKVVLNDWKIIYVFKLERKSVLFHDMYSMKNFLKEDNLASSITIAKNLVKILIILSLWYTKNVERQNANKKNSVESTMMN